MDITEYGLRIEFSFVYSWPPSPYKWETKSNALTEYDLWTVLGGEGGLTHSEGSIHLSAGDCLLLRPHLQYSITHNPDNPFVLLPVHFNFVDNAGTIVYPPDAHLPPLHRKIADLVFFRTLLERVISSQMKKANQLSACYLRAALVEADRQPFTSARVGDGMRGLSIDNMLKRMIAHPEGEYPVCALAKEMGLSKSRFMSLFKVIAGVTPAEHLISARIEKAKTLLRNSGDAVESIATSLGYTRTSFFCRQFKKRTGSTPLGYRKKMNEALGE
ncbi:MAG: helix-turn-helix transcriptional regulator [Candidatus Lindowbacteria bacterium]|nr:helix-turn-helix transcriptional regulator [Candidatus Lindowbacteria bacterium]